MILKNVNFISFIENKKKIKYYEIVDDLEVYILSFIESPWMV